MDRTVRYQGAILRGDHLLLIKHREHASGRSYWLLPGGGLEPPETEEACVIREMQEETHLQVRVERLLLDDFIESKRGYKRYKTYLCRVEDGEAQPGYEPEESASSIYGIVEVGWFDLCHPETWDELARNDAITFPFLQRILVSLGYQGGLG